MGYDSVSHLEALRGSDPDVVRHIRGDLGIVEKIIIANLLDDSNQGKASTRYESYS